MTMKKLVTAYHATSEFEAYKTAQKNADCLEEAFLSADADVNLALYLSFKTPQYKALTKALHEGNK